MAIQGPRAVLRFVARSSKRVGVTIAGLVLVVGGAVLLFIPGPGILVIVAGLAVLATEYAWAERMLDRVKKRTRQAADAIRRRGGRGERPT